MADNAIKTTNDIEIYQHDIYYFADEFIEKELDRSEERRVGKEC